MNMLKQQTVFHSVGAVVGCSILLTTVIGLPRNYINLRLSISWYYLLNWLILINYKARQFAPRRLIAWLSHEHKWIVPEFIRLLLTLAGFGWGTWSVTWVVPHEALSPTNTKAITTIILVLACGGVAWRRFRRINNLVLLRSLRIISVILLVWTGALWFESFFNFSGNIMWLMSPPNTNLKVCAVYVATFDESPRMADLVPAMREHVRRQLEGAEWFVYNGTKMPRTLDKDTSDPIIIDLINKGYISSDAFEHASCGRKGKQRCLQPNIRFDKRVPNLGAAMGHIHILERFVKDHVDDRRCVALVLEDDAILKKGFAATLSTELSTIPSGWDIVSLEGSNQACTWGVWQSEGLNLWHPMKLSEHYNYMPPTSWAGVYTGGYLVTTMGAMRILNKLPLTSNIDTWINALAFYNYISLYVRCPGLVTQGSAMEGMQIPSLTAEAGPKYDKGVWRALLETPPGSTPVPKESIVPSPTHSRE
mmetsp:Transcript_13335/g.22217  ORF Transcript_13335/g.22217 Transcript_13335/m.22217 type:complete len:478 (+) Transcript_13335:1180-2613(+)